MVSVAPSETGAHCFPGVQAPYWGASFRAGSLGASALLLALPEFLRIGHPLLADAPVFSRPGSRATWAPTLPPCCQPTPPGHSPGVPVFLGKCVLVLVAAQLSEDNPSSASNLLPLFPWLDSSSLPQSV